MVSSKLKKKPEQIDKLTGNKKTVEQTNQPTKMSKELATTCLVYIYNLNIRISNKMVVHKLSKTYK